MQGARGREDEDWRGKEEFGLVWAAASEVKIVMSFLGLGLLCLLLFIY
jgi:hypothetical protein